MTALVLIHVAISLVAIVTGFIAMFGMLSSDRKPGMSKIFLITTILTSATGFIIPACRISYSTASRSRANSLFSSVTNRHPGF